VIEQFGCGTQRPKRVYLSDPDPVERDPVLDSESVAPEPKLDSDPVEPDPILGLLPDPYGED
jgi:hypothetical protein